MSSKTLPQSVSDRLAIAVSFALVGPFIGSVAIFAFVVIALASPNSDFTNIASLVMLVFMMGYVFGIGPASVAGIIYAVLPGRMQRLILAPLIGAASVWISYAVPSAATIRAGIEGAGMEPLMLGAGAIAALACAWIARRCGWAPDHSAEPVTP